MKFVSASHALSFYYETCICLTNAKSLDVFYEKTFAYKGKGFSLSRLDLMVTIGYYINKLSKTCVFILECIYLREEDMSYQDIAKRLNDKQNTRNYSSGRVQDIHKGNIIKLWKYLKKADLIWEEG